MKETKGGDRHETGEPKRIFVVGLPRSGTTLVQGMLNSHPGVRAFPESRFYDALVHGNRFSKYGKSGLGAFSPRLFARRTRAKLRTLAGIPGSRALKVGLRFFETAGLQAYCERLIRSATRIDSLNQAFVSTLDEVSSGAWSEKTPAHLFRIPLIERLVPNAKFIHITRNSQDTIASIWDAAQKFDAWHWVRDNPDPLNRLADFCNNGMQISQRLKDSPSHHVLAYEDLVTDPLSCAKKMARHCGLDFDKNMLSPDMQSITTKSEDWKPASRSQITPARSKFADVFSREEQERLKSVLIDG